MSSEHRASLPVRILIKAVANIVVVWAMASYLPDVFQLTGGLGAFIVIGALLTLLNMIVRPVLALITLPLKLFATILAIIIVNGLFVQLTVMIVEQMQDNIVTLSIGGGIVGWTIVAVVFGLANWLLKASLK